MKFRSIFIGLILMLSGAFAAASYQGPTDSLIAAIDYFKDDSASPLTVQQALQRFQLGQFAASKGSILSFGIDDNPVWVRLSINNTASHSVQRRLTAGQIWIEHLDVYLVADGHRVLEHWYGGDAEPAPHNLVPTIGYVFDVNLPSGHSQILIRAQSLDPLTLPLDLMAPVDAIKHNAKAHVASGFLYGILIGLVAFNLVLFTVLKQSYAFYYVTYIGSFLAMNIGYSGYGLAWLYPGSAVIQNYSTLFFMTLHGVFGLVFVTKFLAVALRRPLLYRCIIAYMAIGLAVMTGFTLAQMHIYASSMAFAFLSATTLLMIILCVINLTSARDARYFLLAVSCSTVGLLVTTLSVWGVIPYSFYGFHGAEMGVLCEAVILAALVAVRLKASERERITANYLATYDPLTQLYNRRSFERAAAKLIQSAKTKQKPVSLVMMDVDHFKAINDTFGHHVGDLALKHIAQLLKGCVRKGDLIARWGGEEMILLLPETGHAEAVALTERLRVTIKNSPLHVESQEVAATASFGVCSDRETASFEHLFKQADKLLYQAKNHGRDRVEACLL